MNLKGISIDMLYVGHGEAIIIHVKQKVFTEHNWIILVDGGKKSDSGKIIQHLENYSFKETGKREIDLIISTHPDRDHIGGLFNIIKTFGRKGIKKIWIHDPTNHYSFYNDLINRAQKRIETWFWPSIYQISKESYELVITGLIDGINLVELIKKYQIPFEEPFANLSFADFLRVLGPSPDFYKNLITEETIEQFLDQFSIDAEIYEDKEESDALESMFNPCPIVDENNETSAINNSSVIFEININTDRYLFTGDAGVEAFENIGFDNIENIHWLKVPHHGSRRNLTSGIIETMKPKISYISAEGTRKHPRKALVNCLAKHGSYVYSTHKNKKTLRHFTKIMPDRKGWGEAEPIATPNNF